jgi:type IV pilus assembly protein PilY1
VYPRNGDTSQLWTSNANHSSRINWNSSSYPYYWLYDGNYLNWYYSPGTRSTRLQVMKDVTNSLLNSISGVNVGLMHFKGDKGGRVAYALENIATARGPMQNAVNALTASNYTPLSETLYEGALYWLGRNVNYGLTSPASVPASRQPGNQNQYKSPIEYSCQKNFMIILTDGEPRSDSDSDAAIKALTGYSYVNEQGVQVSTSFSNLVGSTCDVEYYPPETGPWANSGGDCLDELAEFLYKADLSPLPGRQNVVTHTVGFLVDLPILEDTARRGGGRYYTASDAASLSSALTDIVTGILETQTTFTSPAVSVNSFNRTQNLNDLYISVFQPSATRHWPGNLKKFRLRAADSQIVDAGNSIAVDPSTGFFKETARDYWQAGTTTGNNVVTRGGAANRIPMPRNVYTYLTSVGNKDITAPDNRVTAGNPHIDAAVLNLSGAPDAPTLDEIIDFINGHDASDVDNDGNRIEPRYQMGDPLHSQPASVIYGPTLDDAVIYFATNDGYLHAIDAKTGVELWAFLPEEFLPNQVDFFLDEQTATKTYGIDGNLRVQMVRNSDGMIDDPGERVYLFFGMRRGGDVYYGLDVTDPTKPSLLWRHDSGSLPGLGETWSTPSPARIHVQGATQNDEKLVLVIGGGYDPSQDSTAASTDAVGTSIYIIDSKDGHVLWHGGRNGTHKSFAAAGKAMDYSIPADIRVVDFDGDGYADSMYAADMGGQVWRFDIHNGEPASSLITGGVIAQLGAAPSASPALSDVRRFYYAPDIAIVQNRHDSFIHIGIGSGHRAHPLSKVNADRFYALRDYRGVGKLSQTAYDAIVPVKDADLVKIDGVDTSVPVGSPGWRFELGPGEKVLAEARTFNNQVYFTTFTPSSGGSDPCAPALGTNRLYIMSLLNGAPVTNLDGPADGSPLTAEDRYIEFDGSIAAQVVFLFPSPDPECDGENCEPPPVCEGPNCEPPPCEGAECRPRPVACVNLLCVETNFDNRPVRTFWLQEAVDD